MKKLLTLTLSTLLAISLVGCGGSGGSTSTATATPEAPAATTEAKQEEPAKTEADKPLAGKTIGFVSSSQDDYFAVYRDMAQKLVEEAGGKFEFAQSAGNEQTELNNVNDMIVKGVDVICLIAVSSAASGAAVDAAHDAGIPLFLLGIATQSENYTGFIGQDGYGYGYAQGKYAAEHFPDSKKFVIHGNLKSSAANDVYNGFITGVKDAGQEEPELLGEGSYSKEKSLALTQDLITSGREFDLIFAGNDEMGAGVVQALQEAGITDKIVMSMNGKQLAYELVKDGSLTCTISNAPTLFGDICVQVVTAYLTGKEWPARVEVSLLDYIDKDHLDNYIPWDLNDYAKFREEHPEMCDMWAYDASKK